MAELITVAWLSYPCSNKFPRSNPSAQVKAETFATHWGGHQRGGTPHSSQPYCAECCSSFCSFGKSLPKVRKISVKLRPCLFNSPWWTQEVDASTDLDACHGHPMQSEAFGCLRAPACGQASEEVKKGRQELHCCTSQTSIIGNLAALYRLWQHEPLLKEG